MRHKHERQDRSVIVWCRKRWVLRLAMDWLNESDILICVCRTFHVHRAWFKRVILIQLFVNLCGFGEGYWYMDAAVVNIHASCSQIRKLGSQLGSVDGSETDPWGIHLMRKGQLSSRLLWRIVSYRLGHYLYHSQSQKCSDYKLWKVVRCNKSS